MFPILLVGAGGAVGSICRYLLGVSSMRAFGTAWPFGTFAANLIGGVLMGCLVGVLAHRGGTDQERWRLLLGVGVLGGFTTFSTFGYETFALMNEGRYLAALGNISGNLVFGLAAVALGWIAGKALAV